MNPVPESIQKECFTASIDLLGFSEIINGADEPATQRRLNLLRSLSELQGEFGVQSAPEQNGTRLAVRPTISSFSDNVGSAPVFQPPTATHEFREPAPFPRTYSYQNDASSSAVETSGSRGPSLVDWPFYGHVNSSSILKARTSMSALAIYRSLTISPAYRLRYSSSLTFSIQVTALPSSSSVMAVCVIEAVGVAPCQCFVPAGIQTTSPFRISSMGLPHC